jgi:dTDP-4-dehydrorhamnose 3,5-epimerase-like enzyme|tara:strand:+ start:3116 stop:3496 length:381 start_codon:yes stop_codon:yes gene_type:complete
MKPELYTSMSVGSDATKVLHFSELSFRAERIYWIHGPSGRRGGHAHKRLRQSFFCLAGEVTIALNDGIVSEICKLTAGQGALLLPGLWRDIEPLSEGSILLVIASDPFDENDYIREFSEFGEWKNA